MKRAKKATLLTPGCADWLTDPALALMARLRYCYHLVISFDKGRWSGGAMVLGKLPVPGRPTIWITVGQGPTALAEGAGWGLFGHFYSHLSFLSSFSLSSGDGPI